MYRAVFLFSITCTNMKITMWISSAGWRLSTFQIWLARRRLFIAIRDWRLVVLHRTKALNNNQKKKTNHILRSLIREPTSSTSCALSGCSTKNNISEIDYFRKTDTASENGRRKRKSSQYWLVERLFRYIYSIENLRRRRRRKKEKLTRAVPINSACAWSSVLIWRVCFRILGNCNLKWIIHVIKGRIKGLLNLLVTHATPSFMCTSLMVMIMH